MTNESWTMVFVTRVTSKGNEVGDRCDYTLTDTVHSDGRVDVVAKGVADGEYFHQTKSHDYGVSFDRDTVRAARLAQGWTEVTRGG